jgi:hypothetical protein
MTVRKKIALLYRSRIDLTFVRVVLTFLFLLLAIWSLTSVLLRAFVQSEEAREGVDTIVFLASFVFVGRFLIRREEKREELKNFRESMRTVLLAALVFVTRRLQERPHDEDALRLRGKLRRELLNVNLQIFHEQRSELSFEEFFRLYNPQAYLDEEDDAILGSKVG